MRVIEGIWDGGEPLTGTGAAILAGVELHQIYAGFQACNPLGPASGATSEMPGMKTSIDDIFEKLYRE